MGCLSCGFFFSTHLLSSIGGRSFRFEPPLRPDVATKLVVSRWSRDLGRFEGSDRTVTVASATMLHRAYKEEWASSPPLE